MNNVGKTTIKKGEKLVAHHILNFSDNEDIRCDINNGITMSKEIHVLFHNLYNRRNNTGEQLSEFKHNMRSIQ